MGMDANAIRMLILADTSGAQASMSQLSTVTDREMKRAVAAIKPLADAIREQEKAAARAAATVAKAANDESKAMEHVGFQTSAAKRELLVLAHELSQGNYSRFGGSVMVLAERTNLMHLAFSGAGIAVLGMGAAIAGAATLMAKGYLEAGRFAKSLQLTGNYAATSMDAIDKLAAAQSKLTGQTAGGARGSIEAVAGSGVFGPATLAAVSRAMGDYQKITDETAEDALKRFSQIRDGVAKWAEEQNRSIHFLTTSQYAQIKALEETGDKEEAIRLTTLALAQTLESRGTPAVGAFAAAWHFVRDAALDAVQALEKVGRPATFDDRLKELNYEIASNQSGNSGGAIEDRMARIKAAEAEREQILRAQFLAGERAQSQAIEAARSVAGNEARDYVDGVLKKAKATNALTTELQRYRAAVDAAAVAGKGYSKPDVAAGEAEIRKQFAPAGASEYQGLMASVKAYNQATEEEAGSQQRLSEAQKWAIEEHRRLDEIAKSLTATQRKAASAAIDHAAAEREMADALVESRKRAIAAVVEQTAKQEAEDRSAASFLATGEEKVAQLIRETQLIGLKGEALKRAQFAQQLDVELAKASANATAEQRAQLKAFADQIMEHYVVAAQQATAAQKEWNSSMSNGAIEALTDYAEAAQNAAHLAQQTTEHAMASIEDTIVDAAMKGKLNFHALIESILSDYLRLQIIRPLLGGGASFAGQAIEALAGSSSFFPTFANGIDSVPYDGFPAILHEGEKVVRKQDVSRASGQADNIDFSGQVLNVGAGVSVAQMGAALQVNNAQIEMRVRRLVRQGALG